MKKAMLSQPMAGKTDEEIVATREKAIKVLEGKGYEIVNTLFTDEWYSNESMKERGVVQIPLCFLAKSLENMSLCAMQRTSVKAGRMQEDVRLSMMLRLLMVWILFMRRLNHDYHRNGSLSECMQKRSLLNGIGRTDRIPD